MCMEDIRIGRRKRSVMVAGPVVNAGTSALIGADDDRVSITFFVPAGTTIQINNRPLTAATDGGYLGSNSVPVTLDIETHGDIVTKQWHAWSTFTGNLWMIVTRLSEK